MSYYHYKPTDTLYIFNCHGIRKELYELLKYFKPYVLQNKYKATSTVYIELKASGHPLKSMLSKVEYGGFNTRKINEKVVALGKFNRVESSEPFLASGKVVLVEGNWNNAFIEQCCQFPNGSHDDMVDDLTYAIFKCFIKKSESGVSYED
jgi:predicted phage terminase large subunit-like protein